MLTLVYVSWDQITGAPGGDILGGACIFEDLENARESLCQDSPTVEGGWTYLYIWGHFGVPLHSHSYQEYTGTSQDTMLRPSRLGPGSL